MKFPALPRFLQISGLDTRSKSVRMVTLLMSGAVLGKILGLARELLMARAFGASLVADSFRGAISAVLLPLTPMQNEGVPAIMIPLHRVWQEEKSAPRNLAALTVALGLTAGVVMLLVELFGYWWVKLIVGGFLPEGQRLTLKFLQIMALSMPASVILNCLAAAEIATGRYRIASIRAAFLNVAVMAGIAIYLVTESLMLLPWCYTLSFNLLGIWALWTFWREGELDPTGLSLASVKTAWLEFVNRLRPLLMQPFAEQGQIWLERRVGSGLSIGTVASLDYARTLTDSAVLFISQPVGMAVLYKGNQSDTHAQVQAIARPVLALAVPASMFLAIFAPDLVRLVFARGAFNEAAVELTSAAVRGISFGLWAATLGWILIRLLNNAGQNVRAMTILGAGFAINAALNLLVSLSAGGGTGAMYLGLGEAARGIVILLGTAVALGCLKPVLWLIVRCIPAALAMVLICFFIRQHVDYALARLMLGVCAYVLCSVFAYAVLMPDHMRSVLQQLPKWRNLST